MDSGSNKKGSSGAILIMIFCLIVMIYLIGKVSDKEEHSKYTNVTTESTTELTQTCVFKDCHNVMAPDSIYCEMHKEEIAKKKAQTAEQNVNSTNVSGNSDSGKKKNSTYHHSTKSKTTEKTTTEFDPDDHDIEGYYEDNKGDYENIEDAYDGFEDDEDSWEDY